MTQRQLADSIGVNEAAIRNYESQKAFPKKQHIEGIAKALEVRPESLKLYDMGAGDSITANAMFEMARIYGLEPRTHNDYVYLLPTSSFISSAFESWAERYEQLKGDELGDSDYRLWKDCYTADYDVRDFPERCVTDQDGNMGLADNWEARCFSSKLKQLRASRDMTQPDFADMLGIKLGVYRSYEQGWRLPKVSIVESMAKRIGVTSGCLTFFDFGSPVQAIHALFQLAGEYGLRPDVVDGQPILRTQTPGLEQIIEQWRDAMVAMGENGTAFIDWQDHYEPDEDKNRTGYNSRYTDRHDSSKNYLGRFSDRDPYDPKYRHGYLPA